MTFPSMDQQDTATTKQQNNLMEKISLPRIARIAEDSQLEAKFLFPHDTEKQLRWCAVKGMLDFATEMARFLRTAKDKDNRLLFPDIVGASDPQNNSSQDNSFSSPLEMAKNLYALQGLLLKRFHKYEVLLEGYNSTHELLEFIQKVNPALDDNDTNVLQKPKGIVPPETTTAFVRLLKGDALPLPHDKKRGRLLRPEKLRIGNYVSVRKGEELVTVKINGITRRKIGYATTSGAGEKYERLQEVRPLLISEDNLVALLNFKLVDEYLYDGKNYYDDVYHEKVLNDKNDLTGGGLFGMHMAQVHKFELFTDNGLKVNVFIIENVENPEERIAKVEMSTKIGRILHVYYPVFIHEVQNFIDFFSYIIDSHTQVYLNRRKSTHPSEYESD